MSGLDAPLPPIDVAAADVATSVAGEAACPELLPCDSIIVVAVAKLLAKALCFALVAGAL